MYARLSTHVRIHVHIRRNIASRRSEGDLGINMSKNAQPMFEACECKSSILLFYRKIFFSRVISRTPHHVAQTLLFASKKKSKKKNLPTFR